MADQSPSRRNVVLIGLVILVALSLLFAAGRLLRVGDGLSSDVVATPPLQLTPDPGEEVDPQQPETDVPTDSLRELSLAVAAVITALTGLLGLVATQIWRGREEGRLDQKHALALERERLELERERLALEKERLEVERQRQAMRGSG